MEANALPGFKSFGVESGLLSMLLALLPTSELTALLLLLLFGVAPPPEVPLAPLLDVFCSVEQEEEEEEEEDPPFCC